MSAFEMTVSAPAMDMPAVIVSAPVPVNITYAANVGVETTTPATMAQKDWWPA